VFESGRRKGKEHLAAERSSSGSTDAVIASEAEGARGITSGAFRRTRCIFPHGTWSATRRGSSTALRSLKLPPLRSE
jgi:hypothetical protein